MEPCPTVVYKLGFIHGDCPNMAVSDKCYKRATDSKCHRKAQKRIIQFGARAKEKEMCEILNPCGCSTKLIQLKSSLTLH